jgi:hypothetical protein
VSQWRKKLALKRLLMMILVCAACLTILPEHLLMLSNATLLPIFNFVIGYVRTKLFYEKLNVMFTSKIGGTKELDEEIYNQIVQEKLNYKSTTMGQRTKNVCNFYFCIHYSGIRGISHLFTSRKERSCHELWLRGFSTSWKDS